MGNRTSVRWINDSDGAYAQIPLDDNSDMVINQYNAEASTIKIGHGTIGDGDMILNRSTAKSIAKLLTRFAETGKLYREAHDPHPGFKQIGLFDKADH